MSNYDNIRNALTFIDSHDRDTWIQVGSALKDELGEEGFNLWDRWSQGADNYNARDAKAAWKSFKPGFFHIASVFYHARTNGYRPEKPYIPPSAEEQALIQAEREATRLSEEQARTERREQVKHLAQRIWERATSADISHPYLIAKGITDTAAIAGMRQNLYKGNNNLLVPVFFNREIVNVQSINQDGSKRFLADGQVQGGFAVVGDAANTQNGIVIAEGFATAASIYQATGKTVIVAFNAGNMVNVSERLAKSLPTNVPVTLAVDNDASLTGMKKARMAAEYFEGRAQVVEPEFTMAQIRQYQLENGSDEKGRLKLPSDFNDLHHLSGIEAVREKIESAFRRTETSLSEPKPEVKPPHPDTAPVISDEEWAAIVAEEARLSGYTVPPPTELTHQAADIQAASVLQEQDMNNNQHNIAETEVAQESPSENTVISENTIEYVASRQSREPESYEKVDPDHVFGRGRTTASDIVENASVRDESNTNESVPGNVSEKTPEAGQAEKVDSELESKAATVKKPVIDLNYRIPPESIQSRYVVAEGKYLSAANHTTVMFTDAGKKISTPKTDVQTINDMLEVAKEKGWDSIKISGNKEFKAMMYVAAESQGIRTSGYKPTAEDLALVKRLQQERSLNAIEPQPERAPAVAPVTEKVAPVPYPGDKRKQESQVEKATKTIASVEVGERIVDVGTAHYRHDPDEQLSPYIVLEREGKERTVWGVDIPDAMARSGAEVGDRIHLHRLGKQPVEIEVNVRDEDGKVIGTEKKEVERNLFRMEIVQEQRQLQEKSAASEREQEKVPSKPDVNMLSKADKMMAQNEIPSDASINSSYVADTQVGVPLQAVGQSEISSEIAVQAGRMKTAALETHFISAKSIYMDKAAKLSKANKQHLQWHERNVLDTIRGLKGDARTLALTNYYEHTSKLMSGSKLKLPKPIQQAVSSPTHAKSTAELNQRQGRSQSKEVEMDR
ncbi:LPD7 domain-containing protein [Neisseria zalophi]|uniref:Toprim domain-containing protein n=1 Tax=Neisseria zalophi TaxID=640030 RepID=A0A5J6PST3_9NEIS|nr:LPD7 domain-containing protein [Neisseria zalophi]QEY25791.1 toprim domain-containing protein [Neisseria zalophi]